MRVVGLDWAVQPKDRAAVVLEKRDNAPITVVQITTPVDDGSAIDFCKSGDNDVVAVDIPFAWPREFRKFVSNWTPSCANVTEPPPSLCFRYRRTDRFVIDKTTQWPLSVSTDRFALGARAWATIVHANQLYRQIVVTSRKALATLPRPHIVEVYPGATLKVFENDATLGISGTSTRITEQGDDSTEKKFSYKRDEITRRELVESVINAFRIQVEPSQIDQIVSTGKRDDATDGFLAALSGLIILKVVDGWGTWWPDGDQIEDATAEGWIFFPRKLNEGEKR
jgi:hypothetical protein